MNAGNPRDALLVTGATGSIGYRFVQSQRGRRRLCVLVRPQPGRTPRERVAELFPDQDLTVLEGDLTRPGLGLSDRDRSWLTGRLSGVVHLAARTDFEGRELAPYLRINAGGSVALGRLALEAGVPMLHASTAYVAGDHPGRLHEDQLDVGQGFHNPYEQSKLRAEQGLIELERAGLLLTRLRLGVSLDPQPAPVAPTCPGPLSYLRLLRRLHVPAGQVRTLRIVADPRAALSLVPIPWVVRILDGLLERDPAGWSACYHLTARRALTMAEVAAALHQAVPAVRLQPVAGDALVDPDAVERLVARRFLVYQPYQLLRTRWSRRNLEAEFPQRADDEVDGAWLAGLFERHRTDRDAQRPHPVVSYFEDHLRARMHQLLVPDLRSLSEEFCLGVGEVGHWRLWIERGRLVRIEPAAGMDGLGYTISAPDFLELVAGDASPQGLFFRRRISIHGPVVRALTLATALEDFFQLHPYRAGVPGARVPSGSNPCLR